MLECHQLSALLETRWFIRELPHWLPNSAMSWCWCGLWFGSMDKLNRDIFYKYRNLAMEKKTELYPCPLYSRNIFIYLSIFRIKRLSRWLSAAPALALRFGVSARLWHSGPDGPLADDIQRHSRQCDTSSDKWQISGWDAGEKQTFPVIDRIFPVPVCPHGVPS